MAAPIDLSGKWTCDRSENMGTLAEAIGINPTVKSAMAKVKPVHTIQQDGNNLKIDITGTPRDHTVVLTVGEQSKQPIPVFQGDYNCLTNWVGDKLVSNLTPLDAKRKAIKDTREIIDGEYIMTLECGGVVGKTFFKKT